MRLCSSLALTVVALMAGCGSDANYTLQLVPVVPLNQEPFAAEPEVWIAVRDALGNDDWDSIGSLSSGSVEDKGFGPLDGDRVGVALAGKDSPVDAPGTVSAYGETTPLSLAKNKEEVELNVLISLTGGIGALDSLEIPAFGGAIAVLDDGRMYLFGGSSITGGPCQPTIQKAGNLNAGDWAFSKLSTELPEGTCNAKATVVTVDGTQQIVVSGGEATFGGYNNRSRRVSVFDPATETVVWSEQGDLSRAHHTVSALADGRLLMIGYHWIGAAGSAPPYTSYEVFDAAGPGFVRFGTINDIVSMFAMAAPTPGGAAICGGGLWSGRTITPQTTCGILSADGSFASLPSLPVGIMGGAMVRLSDGRLLIAGGIDQPSEAGLNATGSKEAYILDPNDSQGEWSKVGSMANARAFPSGAPDGLGGAMVIGGAGQAWAWAAAPINVAACAERFVPTDDGGTFTVSEPCSDAGSGLEPDVAIHPLFGAFMLQGRTESAGAAAVGVVSRGPSN